MADPIAAYNFEADPIADLSGNGHDFALPAGLSLAAALDGQAIQNNSPAANGGGPAVFGQTPNRSIVVDVIRSANSDGWIVELKDMDGDTGIWGFLFSGGNVQARAKNASNTAFVSSAAQPVAGTRYQLAMTYDGSLLRLYIDATLSGTPVAVTSGLGSQGDAWQLFDAIGGTTSLDNLRIYDVALTQSEIAALLGVPVTEPPPPATGRLKYESAPGVWTPVPLKTEIGDPLVVKTETSPGTWEALP
jgi:hypothetical protein